MNDTLNCIVHPRPLFMCLALFGKTLLQNVTFMFMKGNIILCMNECMIHRCQALSISFIVSYILRCYYFRLSTVYGLYLAVPNVNVKTDLNAEINFGSSKVKNIINND